MTKREIHKLSIKKRDWNRGLRPFGKFLKELKSRLRKESVRLIKWMFFFQPKDTMDAFLHIITVISYVIVGVFIATH
jgi:hypothetical protein